MSVFGFEIACEREETHSHIWSIGSNAGLVVVLGESSQLRGILATVLDIIDCLRKPNHVSSGKSRFQRIVDGVVFQSRHIVVDADLVNGSTVNLAKCEDTCRFDDGWEKRSINVLGSVDAETIKRVVGDKARDPCLSQIDDGLICGIKIREQNLRGAKPAVLVVGLIVIVGNVAERVVIVRLVVWVDLRIVDLGLGSGLAWVRDSHVVNDDVAQEIHAPVVQRGCQTIEVVGAPKVGIDAKLIHWPIAVVGFSILGVVGNVGIDGGDLDCCEAHVLDIVELVD